MSSSRRSYWMVLLAAALLGVVSLGGCGSSRHGHDAHGEGSGEHGGLSLNNGKRWTTDEPLRTGMSRIRDTLDGQLPAIRARQVAESGYDRMARAIDADVAYMVQNCKLDRDTDAMLHRVLADVLAGTNAMQGKDEHLDRRDGALKIGAALNEYGNHFDHPGWSGLLLD